MPKDSYIERITKSFIDKSVQLNQQEEEYKERLFRIVQYKMKDILITDLRLYKKLNKYYDISYTQVVRDSTIAERIIAAQDNPDMDPKKAFKRYFITEAGKEVMNLARKKGDLKTMAAMLNIIGKHNLTDKPDVDKIPYDDIVPFNPVPTFDPSVLGIKPMKNLEAVREKYIKKFGIAKDKYIQERTITIDENDVEDAKVIEDE